VELSGPERCQVVTLPSAMAKLTAVRHLVLYGTNLVRIPPEIGAMTSLEVFEPYTSNRLHWYPYELTRCARLARSTVSTRVLYGNFGFRPPFPALRPVTAAGEADFTALDPGVRGAGGLLACSVCDGPADRELRKVWISRRVGTDVLPLLVNACSAACVAALPEPHPGYIPTPHTGGPDIAQPAVGKEMRAAVLPAQAQNRQSEPVSPITAREWAECSYLDWSNALIGDPELDLARAAEYPSLTAVVRAAYGKGSNFRMIPLTPREIVYRLDTSHA
jgi:hypothetical protein